MRAPTLAIIFAMTVVGCANWQPESLTKQPFTFPRNRPALDTVGIEVAVAEVSHDQLATLEAFWRTLDAQELPLETRQKLDRNGLRCGIMSTQPSADFQELVKPRLPDLDTLDEVGKRMAAAGRIPPVSPLLLHQRVSNQEAQRYPVGVSKIHDSWNRPV